MARILPSIHGKIGPARVNDRFIISDYSDEENRRHYETAFRTVASDFSGPEWIATDDIQDVGSCMSPSCAPKD
jgi:hypothetical protein